MTSNYSVPHNTFPGSEPPRQLPGVVRLDETLNASYLQTIGVDSLDAMAVGQFQAGGEQTSSKGDFLTYSVAVGNSAEGTRYEPALLIDVLGSGQGSVQFADRPDGSFGSINVAPADAPTTTPGNTQTGEDGTKPNSTDTDTSGTTTTTTHVDEQTQEPVDTTDYTPTDAGGTYQTQPLAPPDQGNVGTT